MLAKGSVGPCRVCNAITTKIFAVGSTKLVSCQSCGIVYVYLMPSMEDLQTCYEKEYKIERSENAPDLIAAEHRRLFRLPEQMKLIADIMALKPAPASVLDIGCERAYFLDEIRRHGYNVKGVDSSITARDYSKRIGIDVVPTLNDANETFDIIVLWHTLEHFPNPKGIIQIIQSKLNDEGLILVRAPAFDSAWRKLLGKCWMWYQPENHYFHYAEKSLQNFLELFGFKVMKIRKQRPNDHLTSISYRVANIPFRLTSTAGPRSGGGWGGFTSGSLAWNSML